MRLDPEGNETAALRAIVPDLEGRRVLEVGCGDGRLTCRYAERAGSVVAIDPDPAAIATFRRLVPPRLQTSVEMRAATLMTLAEPGRSFDVVLMSWSL
jgi:2-polyprenyl-3-methyl-5-hydroxy-6-metoxy-1,4-benzoquinol methylase